MIEEKWIDILGWDGKYQISNYGRMKSFGLKFSKKCPEGYITVGCIEKSTGYNAVTLRKIGYRERNRIHVLVASHFLKRPETDKNLCVNHIDGIKSNNHYSNLEWISPGDNIRHAVKLGLHNLKGENHPNAKLTIDKVIAMRRMKKEGKTYLQISEIVGITRRQTSDVIRGVNWGWLVDPI